MLIKWEDIYSVNVGEIDGQHRELLAIINSLSEIQKDDASNHYLDIINELIDYADKHFALEEHYFDLYNYEFKTEHVAQHQEYRQQVDQLKQDYPNNPEEVGDRMMKFLSSWWINHINHIDVKYSECFNEHGLY